MASRLCYLRFISNPEKTIILPHNETIYIGRSRETEIEDLYLSRKQLELIADLDKSRLRLKPIGRSYSGCNGYVILKDHLYYLKSGDRIDLRLGSHQVEVVFEPCLDQPLIKKLKMDSSSSTSITGRWEEIDNRELIMFVPDNCNGQSKVAGFDMDGTIIKTKSGCVFPKNCDDWMLKYNDIPQILQKLHSENYKLVIFTNQLNIKKDVGKIREIKRKIEAIINTICVPIQVFIATGRSIYRKPAPGMWNALVSNNDNEIDVNESFYVGDAAGRPKNWQPKQPKDHSICDRLFALNIKLKFFTPEEYFLKESTSTFVMPEFDPRTFITDTYPHIEFEKLQVILIVGCPGSGKSFYCKNELIPKGFVHINRDILGSWQKCAKLMEESLEANKNVVIDNTNPDKESRQRFIEIANKFNANVKCLVFKTSIKHAKHNNKFRELTEKSHLPVADIIFNTFNKKYQQPELSEGFSEILNIPFIPKFIKSSDEKLYKMFLLEN